MNFFLGEFNRKGFRLHEPLYILILCVSNVTTNVATLLLPTRWKMSRQICYVPPWIGMQWEFAIYLGLLRYFKTPNKISNVTTKAVTFS